MRRVYKATRVSDVSMGFPIHWCKCFDCENEVRFEWVFRIHSCDICKECCPTKQDAVKWWEKFLKGKVKHLVDSAPVDL